MRNYVWNSLAVLVLLTAAYLSAGCEQDIKSGDGKITVKTVTDGEGLLEAVGDPLVGTIEIGGGADIDASGAGLDIKTAKSILIPAGLTVTVGPVKAYANAVIAGKDAETEADTLKQMTAKSGFDSGGAGILKVNGEFSVESGAVFEVKQNANLVFNPTVKSIRVDGVLRGELEGLIYSLGSGVAGIDGAGSVKIAGERTAAGKFTLPAREIDDEGGGNEGGGTGGSTEPDLATIGYRNTANSENKVEFVTDGWEGRGTAAESWILNATEAPAVYFAVKKAANQTISKGGKDAGRVKIATSGTVDGSAASKEFAVIAVDTGGFDIRFEGGVSTFTLAVKKAENNQTIKTIDVTVNSGIDDAYGVTIFKVTRPSGVETLEKIDARIGAQTDHRKSKDELTYQDNPQPVDTLYDANRWLEYNAEDSAEYLIRLNRDQVTKPVNFVMSDNTGVTVRLRGAGGERKITPAEDLDNPFKGASFQNTNGLINAGYNVDKSLTLKLEKNVTIDGLRGHGGVNFIHYATLLSLLYIRKGAMVYMEPGSKITGFYGEAGISGTAPVYVGEPDGKLVMKNGSAITGNEFHSVLADTPAQRWGMVVVYNSSTFTFEREGETIYGNIPDTRKVWSTIDSKDKY